MSQRLRRRAEDALERRRLTEAETLLDRLVDVADGDDSVFAHRHLAELRLERHPWRAALHLRHVLRAHPDDHVPHALMGLSQALLGNYRAAVACYERALQLAPDTPWYLHNLGHLLDLALDRPGDALPARARAHALQPDHDEIAASLAHCHARLGQLDAALALARKAARLAPGNDDHRRLAAWIHGGAPQDAPPPQGYYDKALVEAVRELFERRMRAAGFAPDQIDRARALWREFYTRRPPRARKMAVYAAAVEYAIASLDPSCRATQVAVARRYGIAPSTLQRRYAELRQLLALEPGDRRYAPPS